MAQTEAGRTVDTRAYRTSWRLTFHFDGERISLERADRVRKIALGTTADPPQAGRNSGAWLDLVDEAGKVLFHRLLHNPFGTRAEHHSPDGRIELHVREPQRCRFTAVVPDMPGAVEVVLYASPADHDRMLDAAEEVGRFPLQTGREPDDRKAAR